MKAFSRLLVADLKQFLRDRTAVFFTFAFPLLFMVIFGLVYSGSGDVSYNVAIANEDNSIVSAEISNAIKQIPIFKTTEESLDAGLAQLKKGDVRAVILIPAGTQSDIASAKTVGIVVYYDPSQINSSQIIISVLRQAVDKINQQLTNQPVLLDLVENSVQTRQLSNIDYLVPGILAMAILFLGLFGSITMVERREKKVLKRFAATPIGRSTMIYSQVAYRLALAVMQTLVIVAVARLGFKVNVLGNWLELFGFVLLGTLTFISIGYFAVSRARTTEGAMPIIQLIQFPMLFLSGIFFPVEFMPSFMRPIVEAIPLTYLGDALRQIMVDATPLYSISTEAMVLGGWLVVCITLAIRFFRWE